SCAAAPGAADRPVTTHRDRRWFECWSYAHLPLYLGVGVTGIGLEHIVASGGTEPLHLGEAFLLAGGCAAAILALTLVGAASPELPSGARARRAPGGAGAAAARA